MKTYQIGVYCRNCNRELKPVDVPKGKEASVFLSDKICGNCGLRGFLAGTPVPIYEPEYEVEAK